MMESPDVQLTPEHEGDNLGVETSVRRHFSRIVFAVVSVSFLLYLAFGSVEARIWRFGRLYFEDRHIRDVWGYLGDHLPSMPGQGIITVLYWVSLVVMIAGVILGLWLFLGSEDDDLAREGATVCSGSVSRDA